MARRSSYPELPFIEAQARARMAVASHACRSSYPELPFIEVHPVVPGWARHCGGSQLLPGAALH